MIRFLAFLLIAELAVLTHVTATAGPASLRPQKDLVRASLVAEPAGVRAGETFWVAVRMALKPGWHVYWRNPGDSGLPPEVVWTLPAGFSAGPIRWPAPERIPVATLMNYDYEGEAVLLVPVTPPPSLDPASPVRLAAKLSYLVCETECVPGAADLALTLPVAREAAPDPGTRDLFARAREALPVPSPWPARLSREGGRLVLSLDAAGLRPETVGKAAFFPYSESALDNAAEQVLAVDASGIHLTLIRANPAEPAPATLPGVLTIEQDAGSGPVRRALAIGEEAAPPPPGQIPASTAPAAPAVSTEEAPTLLAAALLAFLGGLVLNLMPCVFPVLSIKVLGLVKHAGEGPERVRLHGFAYTAGVLASFLTLAVPLIVLKSGDAGRGWGFHLQSPAFVAALAYLLLAMGLSLSGAVHFGGRVAGVGDRLTRRAGLEGSFFTGVLATVVATPCTAPFMGTAVGFALTQSAPAALLIFASLGLGLALPFLLLTLWPTALRLLPRPGAWMDVLKQVLAFPLYATVAWLVWVLARQVGPQGLLAALFGLVLVGFAAWAWERGRDSAAPLARAARGLAVLAVIGAGAIGLTLGQDRTTAAAKLRTEGVEPFTQARLDALLAEGRPVFVNMTAAWCITCQVNERIALPTDTVRAALRTHKVTYLIGDWTNQNPEITHLLEQHGRSGVPLYLLYSGSGAPRMLPQILTEGAVVAALEEIGAGQSAALGTAVPMSPIIQRTNEISAQQQLTPCGRVCRN